MANPGHLEQLNQGIEVWNQWSVNNPDLRPDLSSANLSNMVLIGADLSHAILDSAILKMTDLLTANLYSAILSRANLERTNLDSANLDSANLYRANLYGASLYGANLYSANIDGVSLYRVCLYTATVKTIWQQCQADIGRKARSKDTRGDFHQLGVHIKYRMLNLLRDSQHHHRTG